MDCPPPLFVPLFAATHIWWTHLTVTTVSYRLVFVATRNVHRYDFYVNIMYKFVLVINVNCMHISNKLFIQLTIHSLIKYLSYLTVGEPNPKYHPLSTMIIQASNGQLETIKNNCTICNMSKGGYLLYIYVYMV